MAVNVNEKNMTVSQAGILKDYLQGNIDTVATKTNTLVGDDTGKSARTIADEELAKKLIPEEAKDSLDTLEEIAAWIQQHPDDVSKMNAEISKNTSGVAANTSAIEAINNAETGIAKTAKDYADSLNTAMNSRVEELETKSASIEIATDEEFKEALGIS